MTAPVERRHRELAVRVMFPESVAGSLLHYWAAGGEGVDMEDSPVCRVAQALADAEARGLAAGAEPWEALVQWTKVDGDERRVVIYNTTLVAEDRVDVEARDHDARSLCSKLGLGLKGGE